MGEKKKIVVRKKKNRVERDIELVAKGLKKRIEESEEAGTIADPFQLAFDFGSFYDSSDQDDTA